MANLDQEIFFFINHTLHFSLLDKVMPYWRSMYFWLPLYAFFISYLYYNYGKTISYYLLVLALTVGVADFTSSQIIKKNIKRERPCNDAQISKQVKLLVPCGSGYSFPSSHATNHFAAAVFIIFTFVEKRRWLLWSLLFWASSIAFGQVYVGVHYPSDVLFGAILGSFIGWLGAFLYLKALVKIGELLDKIGA